MKCCSWLKCRRRDVTNQVLRLVLETAEINGDLKYCHSIFPVLNSFNEDSVKLDRLSPWLCVL